MAVFIAHWAVSRPDGRSEVAPSIYEGFELRRTNTRKGLAVGLDCPTPVRLKAPMRLRDLLLEASESIPLPNSRRNLLYILSAELVVA